MNVRQNSNQSSSKPKPKSNQKSQDKSTNKKNKKKSQVNQETLQGLKQSFETLIKNKEDQEQIISSLENTIKNLKKNEQSLVEELQRQGDIARDALNKLYQQQQEHNQDREKLRKYYEDFYKTKEQEIIQKYESLLQQSNLTLSDYQKKFKDFALKEQLLSEEVELLKTSTKKVYSPRDRDLRNQMNDMEMKFAQVNYNNDQIKILQNDNANLLIKINQQEKQIHRQHDKERILKEQFGRQISDLQQEIKYWKNEMDKVIRQNNQVISKLTPQRYRY